MAKIIRIENCKGCPHRDYVGLSPEGIWHYCKLESKILPNVTMEGISILKGSTPDWCPLDDAPKTKSEELKEKASQEDNDLKAMNIYTKAKRERRMEVFEKTVLPMVKVRYETSLRSDGYSYIIKTARYGNIIYYPKSDKLLRCRDSEWTNNGALWISSNLL